MGNKYIHIIFPKDITTVFLEDIIKYITENTQVNITVHRIETINEHLDFVEHAQEILPVNSTILFMGHGMSTALSGAVTDAFSYGPFISDNELSIFKNRKIVLLTCRSTEYLQSHGLECGLKAAIGFPNLITDPYELLYPDEPERVAGILEEDIRVFRAILVDIIKYSFAEFINENYSFYQLFSRMKLRAQRVLINFYHDYPDKGKLPLGKMLYDLNDGMSFIGN